MTSDDGIHPVISAEKEYLDDVTVGSEHLDMENTISNTGSWNNTDDYKRIGQTEIISRPDPLEHISLAYKAKALALGFNDMNQSWPQQSKSHSSHAFACHQAAISHTNQPMSGGQKDVLGPKDTTNTILPWCDSAYATAGAFNEDMNHPNPLWSAMQRNSSLNKLRSTSIGIKMLRTQRLKQRTSLDDLEAAKDLILLADISQFYREADEIEDVVVKAQSLQDSIRDPIFCFREDCSSTYASITSNKNIFKCQQWLEPSTSSKNMAEPHISDNLMSDPAPPGAYLTQNDSQLSTRANSPSTRRPVSNFTNHPDGPNHPGLTSDSNASDTPSEPESDTYV